MTLGKNLCIGVNQTLERQKCWVLELEILPGRPLLTLVKHIHFCKTIKHFEKWPAVQLWSQIIFFFYWFFVQTSGKTNLKEYQCFKRGNCISCMSGWSCWKTIGASGFKLFPFYQNHFQYENHMWPLIQTYLRACLSCVSLWEYSQRDKFWGHHCLNGDHNGDFWVCITLVISNPEELTSFLADTGGRVWADLEATGKPCV